MNASAKNETCTTNAFDMVPVDNGAVIREASRSFAFASRLLPEGIADDVRKLYAWCRWCDDAVDSAASAEEAKERLKILRDDVQRIFRDEPTTHPASAWLADLAIKYDIDRQYPLDLLDGMELDLDLGQLRTESELLRYCYLAAGVVGLMMCRVFGVTDGRAPRHAKSLGIAMQLTNIARDVREDSQRGRCYIPKSWLPRGVDGSSQDEIRVAVRRLLDLADEHYKIGYEGLGYLPVKVRPAIRVAAAVYREIGVQIRRRGYQVLRGRIVTPKLRFVFVAVTTWSRGVVRDLKEIAKSFKRDQTDPNRFPVSKDFIVNDAKYLCYLGISLTAFMSSALFLLVMLNPKDASYATLPLAYAAACFTVGLLANLLAKRSETPVPIRVAAEDSTERQQVDVMARRVRSKNR